MTFSLQHTAMTKLTNLNSRKNSVLSFTTELNINKKKILSLMYLETPPIITNSLHLYIKSRPMIIPSYLTTTVNVPKNIK